MSLQKITNTKAGMFLRNAWEKYCLHNKICIPTPYASIDFHLQNYNVEPFVALIVIANSTFSNTAALVFFFFFATRPALTVRFES
jgi:hypothetical protein